MEERCEFCCCLGTALLGAVLLPQLQCEHVSDKPWRTVSGCVQRTSGLEWHECIHSISDDGVVFSIFYSAACFFFSSGHFLTLVCVLIYGNPSILIFFLMPFLHMTHLHSCGVSCLLVHICCSVHKEIPRITWSTAFVPLPADTNCEKWL